MAVNNIKESLDSLMRRCDGAVYAVLVDNETGMLLGQSGGGAGLDLEMLAASGTEIVRADRRTSELLNSMGADPSKLGTEDILFTQPGFFHIIFNAVRNEGLFFVIGIDRSKGNAALARRLIKEIDEKLVV